MNSRYAHAMAACALMIFGTEASAQSRVNAVNPQGELTLARAVDAALKSNPDLIASAYDLSAAQARIIQAGLRRNPELGVNIENFAGTGDVRGINGLETTLSLSQVVELGGKRALRESVAQADFGLVDIEQRSRQLDVLAEVARRYIDLIAAQERVRFASDATALAQQTLDAIGARVNAGRSPEAERSRARIVVTRAEVEQRQAEGELRAARYALSATWGSAEPAFTSAIAALFELKAVDSFEVLLGRLEQSPDFLRFASQQRLREAELRLARVQARPNLTFNVGVRRLESGNDAALVAGFSMPLAVHDRNQGAIREAQVRLRQTEAQLNAAMVRARATLLGLYQELNAARTRADTLRQTALPQAQLALDQTRSGYERGRFSFLELATAQEELLGLRAALIEASADYHRLLAEIERLTGAPLTDPNPELE